MARLFSPSRDQSCTLAIHGYESQLNRLDLARFEEGFAALRADPCGDRLPNDVVALTVDAERCGRTQHAALTVKTFHGQSLLWRLAGWPPRRSLPPEYARRHHDTHDEHRRQRGDVSQMR